MLIFYFIQNFRVLKPTFFGPFPNNVEKALIQKTILKIFLNFPRVRTSHLSLENCEAMVNHLSNNKLNTLTHFKFINEQQVLLKLN